MIMDRSTRTQFVVMCAVCLVIGFAAGTTGAVPNPLHPQPKRPVVEFLKRIGRLGLWMTLMCDRPPQHSPANYATHRSPSSHDHAVDGTPRLSHYEGW